MKSVAAYRNTQTPLYTHFIRNTTYNTCLLGYASNREYNNSILTRTLGLTHSINVFVLYIHLNCVHFESIFTLKYSDKILRSALLHQIDVSIWQEMFNSHRRCCTLSWKPLCLTDLVGGPIQLWILIWVFGNSVMVRIVHIKSPTLCYLFQRRCQQQRERRHH